ncbi:unnamed protein product [Merluccius merluccius]
MSFERVPPRSEVMGWSPYQLADFLKKSDDDYEDPDVNLEDEDSQGDYESPTEEVEENDYEPNPSESTEDFPQVVRPSLPIGEGDYIALGPAAPQPPKIQRHMKPTQDRGDNPSPQSELPGRAQHTLWYTIKASGVESQASQLVEADGSSWLLSLSGQELRQTACCQDGSYLVRDSTQQKANQPYTLMVLYQAKVYNIQIRLQNHQYLLGTGMNVHETFPTVRAMINHYSQTPLLLIDAKNRCSTVKHNQCLLSYPAGYQLT